MIKISDENLKWEIPSHENSKNPGAWKKVLVGHEDVDPKSKLMMVNLARVLVGRVHPVHKHPTMEEIFYFLEGNGEVVLDRKVNKVTTGTE